MMKCELTRRVFKYYSEYDDEPYTFKLSDEKLHTHTTLILKPIHIKLLSNKTIKSNTELRQWIIDYHFQDENNRVRTHNNDVAKKRRAKRRVA